MIVSQTNRNASASVLNGFRINGKLPRSLEDVHRHVHHNPHYVDEVPVDSSELDSVVVLGTEVTAEGAYGHDQEDRQADEDVQPVKPREAEERRRERAVARVEADAVVLDHLREQEREAEQERQGEPALKARAVA